ncbi:MAG: thioredoxin family protein, partial [Nocardioidaceae bacterium]|nr:thioredoxin family protein [Nocardioidaceae bacterium]
MDTGALILLLAAVVAAGFGLYRLRTDGRFVLSDAAGIGPATAAAGSSRTRSLRSEQSKDQDYPAPSASVWSVLAAALPEAVPGERATLVQFSSAFCAPCRTTRTLLADIAAGHAGLRHLEIDAEKHLDLVRRLEVRR